MKLIITASLKKTEYEQFSIKVTLGILKKAARKSLEGMCLYNDYSSKDKLFGLLNFLLIKTRLNAPSPLFAEPNN